jgi:hypothetical protein
MKYKVIQFGTDRFPHIYVSILIDMTNSYIHVYNILAYLRATCVQALTKQHRIPILESNVGRM